ncbi:hypothetical protein BSK59_13400 [Paenibacillus odorifer]|uniref:hypothetical protein n=1 Tax=Paenibacillus odorifer TaxID=189426 RepID=UPI00096BFB59|nr:hypothetical protein [Paenibacillus odorifer]OME55468.1 hypothetical protein BSK59_13400 [Paenibacillus odorifer]
MDNKTDIIAVLIEVSYGVDYTDRYFRPANLHTYVFEHEKQRYVWQSKGRSALNLVEGGTYVFRAVIGERLIGGRGLLISEVEFGGEMGLIIK